MLLKIVVYNKEKNKIERCGEGQLWPSTLYQVELKAVADPGGPKRPRSPLLVTLRGPVKDLDLENF